MDEGGNILLEYTTNYFKKGIMQIIASFGIVFIFIFLAANDFFRSNAFLRTIASYFFPIERVDEASDEIFSISSGIISPKWMAIIAFISLIVIFIFIYFIIYALGNWISVKNKIYFNDAHYMYMDNGLNIMNKKGNFYFPYENIKSIGDTFMKMQMAASIFPRNRTKFILLKIQMKDNSSVDIHIPRVYNKINKNENDD